MQPYFYPYIGYYRLFVQSDIFVIYDCVQYIRRGWIHRNQININSDDMQWLTLPICKPEYNSKISEVRLKEDYINILRSRLLKFSFSSKDEYSQIKNLIEINIKPPYYLVDYLELTLKEVLKYLDFNVKIIRSSSLDIPPHFRSEDRIIQILKKLKATSYFNSPGGKDLYCENNFMKNGIKLKILKPYNGPKGSILNHLFIMDKSNIRALLQ